MLKKHKGKIGILIIETVVIALVFLGYNLLAFYSNNPYSRSNEIYSFIYYLEKKDIVNYLTVTRIKPSLGNSNLSLSGSGEFIRSNLEQENLNEKMKLKWIEPDVAYIEIPVREKRIMKVYMDFHDNRLAIYAHKK